MMLILALQEDPEMFHRVICMADIGMYKLCFRGGQGLDPNGWYRVTHGHASPRQHLMIEILKDHHRSHDGIAN
jgi:hypothetical protein